jgi:hypothetical protein
MKRLSVKSVKKWLHEFNGNISAVARKHDVCRSSVADFINRRPELVKLCQDCRETMVDNAESSLGRSITAREAWAVCFALKTQGKARGYIEKADQTPMEKLLAGLPAELATQLRAALAEVHSGSGGSSEGPGDPASDRPAALPGAAG